MKDRRNGRALLIVPRNRLSHLDEALSLAETAGYEVSAIIKTRHPKAVKKGFIDEVKRLAGELKPEAIIFYGDIRPSSSFILMRETGARVIDRVMLILEIFANHASSKEALLQIEAARIRHEIPLVRELIRRAKMGEFPGFLGPGRYAVDEYYRHLTRRLARIRRELEKIKSTRESRLRSRSRDGILHVAIVGYASAGKTSIFNLLTGEKKPVGPEYFTTLHPKHSALQRVSENYRLRKGFERGWNPTAVRDTKVVVADTVGFLRDVPPEIVEAFHATLAEIKYSDLIVFVVDVSEDLASVLEKLKAGIDVLARIGAIGIPMIIAANKVDLVEDWGERVKSLKDYISFLSLDAPIIPVSAKTGYGIDELADRIASQLIRGRPTG